MRRTSRALLTVRTAMALSGPKLVVDPFCLRQFDKASGKTPFIGVAVPKFEAKVNELFEAAGGDACLVDGYAPFCKHIFVENFAGCTGSVAAAARTSGLSAAAPRIGRDAGSRGRAIFSRTIRVAAAPDLRGSVSQRPPRRCG